jgi:uncharacterized membrane protein YqjE
MLGRLLSVVSMSLAGLAIGSVGVLSMLAERGPDRLAVVSGAAAVVLWVLAAVTLWDAPEAVSDGEASAVNSGL